MAKYKGIVTTDAGLELLAKACSGGSVKFTAVKTGDGVYDGTEDLSGMTALKSEKQSFGVSGITRIGTQVRVRSVLNNEGLTTGYNITEVGLFATDPDTGSEFLYAIIVAETGFEDYLPPHEDSPSSITMEIYLMLTETENAVTFTAEVVAGTYASAEDLQDHVSSKVHITLEERTLWNATTEDVTNIFNGDAQVGNAATLDGHEAEYFAQKEELEHFVVTSYSGNTEEEINAIHNSLHANALDGEWYRAKVVHGTAHSILLSGQYYIEGFRVTATWGYQRAVSYRGSDTTDKGAKAFERSINNGTWNEWQRTAYAVDLAKYLPLTGGTVENSSFYPIAVKRTDINSNQVALPFYIGDTLLGSIGAKTDGKFYLYDANHNAIGALLNEKNYSSYALPLTGGTVNNGGMNPLSIKGAATTSLLRYYNSASELLGYLGFINNKPVFQSNENKANELLHTGNKPTGTYTGNGSATQRTIDVGGIGNMCVIYDSTRTSMTICMPSGAIYSYGTDAPLRLAKEELCFENGKLYIASTKGGVNYNGTAYTYEVH